MRCILLKFPQTECDLHCAYCYLGHRPRRHTAVGDFMQRHSPEAIAETLSPQRVGGSCFFYGYADGEPLLHDVNVKLLAALAARGHFAAVTTNLNAADTGRLERVFAPSNRWRVLFLASLHWHELLRTGRLDAFFDTMDSLRATGFSCRVRLCFAPEYLSELEAIDALCIRRTGQLPLLTRWRATERPCPIMDDLDSIGTRSPIYRLQKKCADIPRREFCLAGERSAVLDLGSGEFRACLAEPVVGVLDPGDQDNRFAFLGKPVGCQCHASWCMCCSILWPWGVLPELFPGTWSDLFFAPDDRFVTPALHAALSAVPDASAHIDHNPAKELP